MSLTNHQQEVFKGIIDSFGNFTNQRIVLCGYAGTGKTYLIGKIVEHLDVRYKDVLICAPTHKAAQVLKGKCHVDDEQIITIASLLNLQPDVEIANFDPENPIFRRNTHQPDKWLFYHAIIIDEASMIPSALLKELEKIGKPILFVGDPAQLPPVKESHSPVFDYPNIYFLTEIIRTNKSDILDLSMLLRSDNYKEVFNYKSTQNVTVCDSRDFDIRVDKYLAYRNARVTEANRRIKQQFNPSDRKIDVGDEIMFYQPIYNDRDILFNNSEELIVSKREFIDDNYDQICFSGKIGHWNIVKEKAFNGYVKKHKQYVESKNWKAFYNMRYNYFLDDNLNYKRVFKGMDKIITKTLDLSYAMTVHKSQGSTYQSVAIELSDLQNSEDAQALLYTAVTRAADTVYLLT